MALYDDLHTGFRYLCHEINQVGLCLGVQMDFWILRNHHAAFRGRETSYDDFRHKAYSGTDMVREKLFAAARFIFYVMIASLLFPLPAGNRSACPVDNSPDLPGFECREPRSMRHPAYPDGAWRNSLSQIPRYAPACFPIGINGMHICPTGACGRQVQQVLASENSQQVRRMRSADCSTKVVWNDHRPE